MKVRNGTKILFLYGQTKKKKIANIFHLYDSLGYVNKFTVKKRKEKKRKIKFKFLIRNVK